MRSRSSDNLIYLAFAISVFFGGLNAIGVRYVVAELPPFWGATIRFAPASLLVFALVWVQRLSIPRGKALLGAVIYGVFNFGIAYALAFWALQTVPPGLAMVILSLTPLFTLLFAILHGQEKFRWAVLLGSLLSLAGIGVIFAQQVSLDVPLFPLLAIVLNAACFAEATVIVKAFPKSHPITTNAIGMLAGAVILFVASLVWREPRPIPVLPVTWSALAYLIVIGSCVVFILMLYVLKQWTASATSYGLVLLPIVTVPASTLLGQEKITPAFLIGAALILLGVYFGALRKPRSRVEAELQARIAKQAVQAPTD